MDLMENGYCEVHTSQVLKGWCFSESLVPERLYFRCYRLSATLSVARCRENRAKIPFVEALNRFDVLPPNVQPLQCVKCPLARQMEANKVEFFTTAQVLQGEAIKRSREQPSTTKDDAGEYSI